MAANEDRSRIIASGTAEGLLAFADYLREKGYASPAATSPWKSAARQVFSTVEGGDWKTKDVRGLDLDEYMSRFETMTRGQYKAESIASYRARVKKALEAYEDYLRDGRTPTLRQSRPRRTSVEKSGGASAGLRGGGEAAVIAPAAPSPVANLVEYPFPVRSGMAYLRLPRELDKTDAERLATFVRTLVFEPQLAIGDGNSEPEAGK